MPAEPPVAFATICSKQQGYILSITPSQSGHLVLRHPEPELSVCDNQTLEKIATLTGHRQPVTDVVCGEGIWSSSLDASIIRWDGRSGREAMKIDAFLRKPLPLTCLEVAESDHLVMAGTELQSSEAHILFYDVRNPSQPAYVHSSTHSDDLTSLHLLPPTGTFARALPGQKPLPDRLLLSTSTDGCIALSSMRETDEQEALLAEENWGMSVAASGAYAYPKGGMRLWARSDQDCVATWNVEYNAEEAQLELNGQVDFADTEFKFKKFTTPKHGPNTVHAVGETKAWPEVLESRYIIDVCPSLGVGKTGAPMLGVGTNDGDIVLEHCAKPPTYAPSAYFVSGPQARGHKDVVRCMTHVRADEVLYTGSEDGVLAGWSLAALPPLAVGNPDIDDDGGDGRNEDTDSDESMDTDEELEISDRSDSDDSDDSDMGGRKRRDGGFAQAREPKEDNPVLRGRDRKDARRGKRHAPY